MKDNKFRQAVDSRLASVVLSSDLRERILAGAVPKKRRPRPMKRILIAAVAACLTVAFGITVVANGPGFELFIEHMGEDFRQLVQPLSGYSISDGVRMELVAAVNDGENVVAYITLQDVRDSRLDDATELCDVSTDQGMMHVFDGLVHFDESTKTATYRLTLNSTEALNSRPISLKVNSLLTGSHFEYGVPTGLTAATLSAVSPSTTALNNDGGFGITNPNGSRAAVAIESALMDDSMPSLQQNEHPRTFPELQGISVSNSGFVNDVLHLQTYRDEGVARFNRYDFSLSYPGMDESVPLVTADYSIGEREQLGFHTLNAYHESLFELPSGIAPEDVQLVANVSSYEELIKGEWKISFIPRESAELKSAKCEIDMNGWIIHEASLSSIGVNAIASGDMSMESDMLEVEVWMKDGTQAEIYGSMSTYDGSSIVIKSSFSRPINLDDVDRVLFNGNLIELS